MEWNSKRYWRLWFVAMGMILSLTLFRVFELTAYMWIGWSFWGIGVALLMYCYWRAYWKFRADRAARKAGL